MEDSTFAFVLTVFVAGVAAQWVGWRLRIPAIVVLLAVGLLAGPGYGWIDPSVQLGDLLPTVIGLGVAIIVFEGGLSLNLRELREAGVGLGRLIVIGLPLNWFLGAWAAHGIVGLSWPVSIVFGAILVVTGPTVILPMLRTIRLRRRTAALLKWEAVVNDPIGAIVTIVALEYWVVSARLRAAEAPLAEEMLLHLAPALLGITLISALAALGVREAFHRDLVPEILKQPILLAGALGLYATGNLFYPEAGLVGATLFGVALANLDIAGLKALSRSKESLSVLIVSAIFIILAADIGVDDLRALTLPIMAGVAAVVFLVRPIAMLVALLGSPLPWRERLLVGWIGPRGIVAAALAGIAATEMIAAGYTDATILLPMVFAVITGTVVVHGLTFGPVSRLLRLRATEKPGLMIVGANPWSVALASVLRQLGVPVVMVDRSWMALRQARENDIPGLAVEILSERVEAALDTGQVDYVLAATDDDAYNALVCARFAPELGRERVHQLAMHDNEHAPGRRKAPAPDWRGKILGSESFDHKTVNDHLAEGWRFDIRQPTASGAAIAKQSSSEEEMPLLTVRADGRILFHSPERAVKVRDGDCVVTFIPPGQPMQRTGACAALDAEGPEVGEEDFTASREARD